MNLHIIQEGVISEAFYNNIRSFGLIENNQFFLRHSPYFTGKMTIAIPHGKLDDIVKTVGATNSFNRVFIHQLSPLYYRWISDNKFQELNWLIWGADLYQLPFIEQFLYEPLTLRKYVKDSWTWEQFLFLMKYSLFNRRYKKNCYSKIDRVLTWMKGEYDFAKRNIAELKAAYDFFLYENKIPYSEITSFNSSPETKSGPPKLIIGNSGTPSNNHLDVVQYLIDENIKADILLPVSYGEKKYIEFLKRNLNKYENGSVTFLEDFLPIHDYLSLLRSSDALIINSIRPQAYGNIFMMMLVNKPVFFNPKNISLLDLDHYQIEWRSIEQLKSFLERDESLQFNNKGLLNLTSRGNLKTVYTKLFS